LPGTTIWLSGFLDNSGCGLALWCTEINAAFNPDPENLGLAGIWPVAANILPISLARIDNALCNPVERQ
jgi:hypothetical protein